MWLLNLVEDGTLQYMAFEPEVGKKGTPHLQGFFYCHSLKSRPQVSEMGPLERAWLAPKKGTDEQCKKYCQKDGKFMWMGEPPEQGKRSDIDDFVEAMKKEPDFRKIAMAYPRHALRMMRNAKELHAMMHPMTYEYAKKEVHVVWGETGLNKTRRCIEFANEEKLSLYVKNACTGQWWDNYHGQDVVVLNEFRAGMMKFSELLELLDGYQMQVPVKGGFEKFQPKYIFLTSDTHPKDWYSFVSMGGEDSNVWKQLERRITKILHVERE